jgi:hypothetical protein
VATAAAATIVATAAAATIAAAAAVTIAATAVGATIAATPVAATIPAAAAAAMIVATAAAATLVEAIQLEGTETRVRVVPEEVIIEGPVATVVGPKPVELLREMVAETGEIGLETKVLL